MVSQKGNTTDGPVPPSGLESREMKDHLGPNRTTSKMHGKVKRVSHEYDFSGQMCGHTMQVLSGQP